MMNGSALVGQGPVLDALSQWGQSDVAWRVVALADFNSDGHVDVVWQHTDGRVNRDLNGLMETSTMNVSAVASPWKVRMVTDFNADGKPDILWQYPSPAWLYVWFMNGSAIASDGFVTPSAVGAAWRVVGGN